MKARHRALLGASLVAVLAISLGFAHPSLPAAEAQHGHGAGAQEQFDAFATQLDLSDEQRHAIAAPFHEGFAALQNLHRLHGLIAAELTDEQKQEFAEMVHRMVGASFAGQGHGEAAHEGEVQGPRH